jgi:2,4-dichlorophenol 6-monooxygenase
MPFQYRYIQSLIADSFIIPRKGDTKSQSPKVFLAGDAAHRIIPWGALGLNTGVQDTSNIAWKLALAVYSPKEFGSLLGSYNAERRPLAITVAKHTKRNFEAHERTVDASIGLHEDKTVEQNWKETEILFEDAGEDGQKKRQKIKAASAFLDSEYAAHGIEMGYRCKAANIIHYKKHATLTSSYGRFRRSDSN